MPATSATHIPSRPHPTCPFGVPQPVALFPLPLSSCASLSLSFATAGRAAGGTTRGRRLCGDVLAAVDADVLAHARHQRAKQVAAADDEAQLLACAKGEADREQVDLEVDRLAGRQLGHTVKGVSGGDVVGRERRVELTDRRPQPPVRALVAQDGGAVVRHVVDHRALVGHRERLQRRAVGFELCTTTNTSMSSAPANGATNEERSLPEGSGIEWYACSV